MAGQEKCVEVNNVSVYWNSVASTELLKQSSEDIAEVCSDITAYVRHLYCSDLTCVNLILQEKLKSLPFTELLGYDYSKLCWPFKKKENTNYIH